MLLTDPLSCLNGITQLPAKRTFQVLNGLKDPNIVSCKMGEFSLFFLLSSDEPSFGVYIRKKLGLLMNDQIFISISVGVSGGGLVINRETPSMLGYQGPLFLPNHYLKSWV